MKVSYRIEVILDQHILGGADVAEIIQRTKKIYRATGIDDHIDAGPGVFPVDATESDVFHYR